MKTYFQIFCFNKSLVQEIWMWRSKSSDNIVAAHKAYTAVIIRLSMCR